MAELEEIDLLDPHPDIHELFTFYNETYFESRLGACTVEWSTPRMTQCAGVCKFSPGGGCEIKLSEPLLKYRPTSDLKETLLHEMIHAYLFSTNGNKDHDDHGPCFQHLMMEINGCTIDDCQRPANGYRISICHNFKDEVEMYRGHQWTCENCGDLVMRANNRVPSSSDCPRGGPGGQSCSAPNCHWHIHELKCGGVYKKTAEPVGYVDRRKVRPKNSEDVEDTALLALGGARTVVGKKRPSLHATGGIAKRGTVNSSGGPIQTSNLDKFLVAVDKGSENENVMPLDNEAGKSMVVESNGLEEEEAIKAAGPSIQNHCEDNTEISLNRKRTLRPRNQYQQETRTVEPVVKPQASEGGCRKRRRPEEVQGCGKQAREPTVILAWKGWYTSEGEEGEEGMVSLINKRDERRRLERQGELIGRESERADADAAGKSGKDTVDGRLIHADKELEESVKNRCVVETAEVSTDPDMASCISQIDKTGVQAGVFALGTAFVESQTVGLQGDAGLEGADNGSLLGESLGREVVCESDIEFGSGESKVGDSQHATGTHGSGTAEDGTLAVDRGSYTVVAGRKHLGNVSQDSNRHDDVLGVQSWISSTPVLVSVDQQADLTNSSALEEKSMVVDPVADGIAGNPEEAVRVSDESFTQSTRTNICTEAGADKEDKQKSFHGGASCCTHKSVINLDDEEQDWNEHGRPVTVGGLATKVVVNDEGATKGPSNLIESQHLIHIGLPSCDSSRKEWCQSGETVGPSNIGDQVSEEQGENTGWGANDGVDRRGKQKVIELSDEEEDSNRCSIERRALTSQQRDHIFDGHAISDGDGGAGTTSGAGNSSVCMGGRYGSGISQCFGPEEMPQSVDGNLEGGTVESVAPQQGSSGSGKEGETKKVITYRRRLRRGKAIAGHDSGEEVRGPLAKLDDSPEESGGGSSQDEQRCPGCQKVLPKGMSNAELNSHLDQCLISS